MKFGLKAKTIAQINTIFANYPQIKKAVLYGSRAKGNYKNGSDIDLTLIGEGLTLNILYKISLELDDLLLPYTIDLSIYHYISNHDLIAHIQRVGMIFFERSQPQDQSPVPVA